MPNVNKKNKKFDPFYSPENMKYLKEAIERVEAGHYITHDIIEPDEELDPAIYSPENKKRILESIKQYENGEYSIHSLDEIEEMLKDNG